MEFKAHPSPLCSCLEIGCGSGYVICSLALLLKHLGIDSRLLACDIDPHAVDATTATLTAHGVLQMLLLLFC
jgi:release factor glutamine methyltransferase